MELKERHFIALGPGGQEACRMLPAYPLKLYLNLMILADRQSGRVGVRCRDLAEILHRSKKSVGEDLEELRNAGVCKATRGANQSKRMEIEICDEYWPYVKPPKQPSLDVGASQQPAIPGLMTPVKEIASETESCCAGSIVDPALGFEAESAFSALLGYGIAPEVAKELVRTSDATSILDNIDYVSWIASRNGSHIHNPQGMLIYRLREHVPVPLDFVSSRKRNAQEEASRRNQRQESRMQMLEWAYRDWCRAQGEAGLEERYSPSELENRITEQASNTKRTDKQFANMPSASLRLVVRNQLIKAVCAELSLPSFEEWRVIRRSRRRQEQAMPKDGDPAEFAPRTARTNQDER